MKNSRIREETRNKRLIKKYPWLQIRGSYRVRDRYGILRKQNWQKDFSTTWLDSLPKGWRKAWGDLICEDIAKALKKDHMSPSEYRIDEVKSKFGGLRWYDNGGKHVQEVIRKYERISEYTCECCGEFPSPMTGPSWYMCLCAECYGNIFGDHPIENAIVRDDVFDPISRWTVFSTNGNHNIEYDCQDIADKIIKRQAKERHARN